MISQLSSHRPGSPSFEQNSKYGYHRAIKSPRPLLRLSLLANLTLNTPLQRLPLIMLQLPPLLLRFVTSKTRQRAANSATNAVTDALSKVADLSLCLLGLAVGILLFAGLAHAFEAERAAQSFLAGADGLVPGAGAAVGVVGCDALSADGETTDVAAGVGEVIAGGGFGLLLLGLVLGEC